MKIICPTCSQTMREFELTENERLLFSEEELALDVAEHFQTCPRCQLETE